MDAPGTVTIRYSIILLAALFSTLLGSALIAASSTKPPKPPKSPKSPKPTTTNYRIPADLQKGEFGKLIDSQHYQILGILFQDITLTDVQSKIGPATIYQGNHGAEHLCYHNNDSQIELMVSGMGYGYTIKPTEPDTSTTSSNRCLKTKESVKNQAGLERHLSKQQVIALLGQPSKVSENNFSYIYWVQQQPSSKIQDRLRKAHALSSDHPIWMDVLSIIQINFIDERVETFGVSTTVTF